MKLNPALLALAAGGVAALLLLRPKAAATTPQKGFLDRVMTWADAFPTTAAGEAVKSNVESVATDLGDWLRRIDPRPDPLAPGSSTIVDRNDYYDPMLDRWNYPALGAALYRWGPGEGW